MDFKAYSCLIITEPREFLKRVFKAFDKKLKALKGFAAPVRYIYLMYTDFYKLDMFHCRHFRYSYQKEYRIVWLPLETETHLEFITIESESLKQFCELIRS